MSIISNQEKLQSQVISQQKQIEKLTNELEILGIRTIRKKKM
ncbi:MAG: hypothetical protein NY202_04700 [Mollicutes bacterium UO1]